MSSIMQSVLMGLTDPVYAEELHQSGLHPYSQYLIRDKDGKLTWVIHTMEARAKQKLLIPLMNDDFQEIAIQAREERLRIRRKTLEECSEDDLFPKPDAEI